MVDAQTERDEAVLDVRVRLHGESTARRDRLVVPLPQRDQLRVGVDPALQDRLPLEALSYPARRYYHLWRNCKKGNVGVFYESSIRFFSGFEITNIENNPPGRRKEMFYLTTHSTHFIFTVIWRRT